MAVAGLSTYNSTSFYHASVQRSRGGRMQKDGTPFGLMPGEEDGQSSLQEAAKQAVATSPYTRCITASIRMEEMFASQSDSGEMIYSYQASEQRFQIWIKSDGENKTYSVKGIGKDGEPFEKEFNPYDVDPENADFPEFSALCMYIRQTDETADLLANEYFASGDILEKRNYMDLLGNFGKNDLFDQMQFMVDFANKLFHEMRDMMNQKNDVRTFFEPYRMELLTMDMEKLSSANRETEKKEPSDEQLRPLGIGFVNVGNIGYGMSADQVISPDSDEVVVRVRIAKGGSNFDYADVNLSKFDPKNATAVEMFAYCQYMDAIGKGTDHKWGSWNAMKKVMSPMDGANFDSLGDALNKKMDWSKALADSQTVLQQESTGETFTATDLLKMFEEANKLTAEKLKSGRTKNDLQL